MGEIQDGRQPKYSPKIYFGLGSLYYRVTPLFRGFLGRATRFFMSFCNLTMILTRKIQNGGQKVGNPTQKSGCFYYWIHVKQYTSK